MKYEAILALHNETNPNTGLSIYGSVEKLTSLEGVKSNNESPKFTWDEVLNKEKELQAIEPMRLLRQERDRRIVETDWWAGQDLTMTQKQKIIAKHYVTYHQQQNHN